MEGSLRLGLQAGTAYATVKILVTNVDKSNTVSCIAHSLNIFKREICQVSANSPWRRESCRHLVQLLWNLVKSPRRTLERPTLMYRKPFLWSCLILNSLWTHTQPQLRWKRLSFSLNRKTMLCNNVMQWAWRVSLLLFPKPACYIRTVSPSWKRQQIHCSQNSRPRTNSGNKFIHDMNHKSLLRN